MPCTKCHIQQPATYTSFSDTVPKPYKEPDIGIFLIRNKEILLMCEKTTKIKGMPEQNYIPKNNFTMCVKSEKR